MRRLAPVAVVLAAATLAACSSSPAESQISGLSPAKAVSKACEASLKAGGVTAAATVKASGYPTLHTNITFAGANSKGTLDFGKGGTAEEVGNATAMYLRGSATFWKTMTKGVTLPADVLRRMDGKWLEVRAKGAVAPVRASILRYGDPRVVIKGCTGRIGGVTADGTGRVEGQDVLRFAATDSSGTKVDVAASNHGEPYVLGLGIAKEGLAIDIAYSNYGATVDASVPKPSYDLTPILSLGSALTAQGLNLYR